MSYLIHTEIDIDAPRQLVWDVLVDLDRHTDWNPFIRKIEGTIGPGEKLHMEPRTDDGRDHAFDPVVTEYVAGKSFAWTGNVLHRLIASGIHRFDLEDLSDGRCRVHHDEIFSGLLLPITILYAGGKTRRGFEEMNVALKGEVESRATA
ncbi:MAG: SRPBCC domain-containing protein [Alphaproteobacteria bacterium]